MMSGFNFEYVWFLTEYAHQMAVNIHPMKSTDKVYVYKVLYTTSCTEDLPCSKKTVNSRLQHKQTKPLYTTQKKLRVKGICAYKYKNKNI